MRWLTDVGGKRSFRVVSGTGPAAACFYLDDVFQGLVPMEVSYTITEV